jgi:exosortase E/protease (VPEID-CTERM system)
VLGSPEKAFGVIGQSPALATRVAAAAGVLLLEKTLLNFFVDFASAQSAEGLGAVVRVTQHWGLRFLVTFVVVAAVFGYLRKGPELQQLDADARAAPIRPRWLLAHLALFVPLVPLSASLYGHAIPLPFGGVLVLWLLLAILASAALFAALAPLTLWSKAVRALGAVWWYAAITAAGAAAAMGWSQGLWARTTQVTFEVVYRLLDRLVPALEVDPANKVIDTGRFAVEIAPVCSGVEGMGLMLAFCATLLLLFRREYIFPRALLLIPVGLLLSFVLNIARIAGLVLIGNAGYTGVAVYGFHSQAGWIAFNAAAVGIAFVSLRSAWFSHAAARHGAVMSGENPTAVYLLPYLALLLAGMVSRAASGGFEGLYWVRLLLAGAALCYSWPRLHGVDWRFSWRGAAGGVAAFAAWIITASLLPHAQGVPAALAALPPISRAAWITGQVLVSVAVTPLTEELAFRGYLLRRIHAPDFESVAPGQVSGLALAISAVTFGLCQGVFWLPGIVSGLVFGLVYMRTGRLGEAIAAHVTGNALLTAVVLGGSQWQLW